MRRFITPYISYRLLVSDTTSLPCKFARQATESPFNVCGAGEYDIFFTAKFTFLFHNFIGIRLTFSSRRIALGVL